MLKGSFQCCTVDLNQKKLDEIFENESKDDIAIKISEAVIERQLQKNKNERSYIRAMRVNN
jgi:hypothetical protein